VIIRRYSEQKVQCSKYYETAAFCIVNVTIEHVVRRSSCNKTVLRLINWIHSRSFCKQTNFLIENVISCYCQQLCKCPYTSGWAVSLNYWTMITRVCWSFPESVSKCHTCKAKEDRSKQSKWYNMAERVSVEPFFSAGYKHDSKKTKSSLMPTKKFLKITMKFTVCSEGWFKFGVQIFGFFCIRSCPWIFAASFIPSYEWLQTYPLCSVSAYSPSFDEVLSPRPKRKKNKRKSERKRKRKRSDFGLTVDGTAVRCILVFPDANKRRAVQENAQNICLLLIFLL